MSQVLNIRLLPGFSERQPIIPPGAVYIGRANSRYRQASGRTRSLSSEKLTARLPSTHTSDGSGFSRI
jgi:hypothetical protein